MVVVFSIELSAIDQPHRHLQAFVKCSRLLQVWRRLTQSVNEISSSRREFSDGLLNVSLLMSKSERLKARRDRRSVDTLPPPKVLQSLLPKFFHVGEMPDVLRNGPLAIQLKVR